jgi:hypothetical protein
MAIDETHVLVLMLLLVEAGFWTGYVVRVILGREVLRMSVPLFMVLTFIVIPFVTLLLKPLVDLALHL